MSLVQRMDEEAATPLATLDVDVNGKVESWDT